MRLDEFKYCVAIRTLGRAGAKYQKELESIACQTVKPERILVYLAEGYPVPKETIGIEEVIYVKKGMVAQRALNYNEVTTEWMLLLDDDVYLPPDAVEKLAKELTEMKGDCIVADTFANHMMPFRSKVRSAITNWALPMYSEKWAIKIGRTGSFSYNNSPIKPCYYSQSGAGPCSLWRKEIFEAIHFEDELWLDNVGFAYGDDLFLFYKLFKNGYRLLTSYDCGVEHLDSKSSRSNYKNDSHRYYTRTFCWLMIWYRTQYEVAKSAPSKFATLMIFLLKCFWNCMLYVVESIKTLSIKPLSSFFIGNIEAMAFIRSADYKSIRKFVL